MSQIVIMKHELTEAETAIADQYLGPLTQKVYSIISSFHPNGISRAQLYEKYKAVLAAKNVPSSVQYVVLGGVGKRLYYLEKVKGLIKTKDGIVGIVSPYFDVNPSGARESKPRNNVVVLKPKKSKTSPVEQLPINLTPAQTPNDNVLVVNKKDFMELKRKVYALSKGDVVIEDTNNHAKLFLSFFDQVKRMSNEVFIGMDAMSNPLRFTENVKKVSKCQLTK